MFLLFRSRGVVRIEAKMTFEPDKINIFNKNCQRGGKEVTCMSVVVCLRLDSMTKNKKDYRKEVGEWRLHIFCWLTYSAVGNFQIIVVVWTRGLVWTKSGQVWFSQCTTKNQQNVPVFWCLFWERPKSNNVNWQHEPHCFNHSSLDKWFPTLYYCFSLVKQLVKVVLMRAEGWLLYLLENI